MSIWGESAIFKYLFKWNPKTRITQEKNPNWFSTRQKADLGDKPHEQCPKPGRLHMRRETSALLSHLATICWQSLGQSTILHQCRCLTEMLNFFLLFARMKAKIFLLFLSLLKHKHLHLGSRAFYDPKLLIVFRERQSVPVRWQRSLLVA